MLNEPWRIVLINTEHILPNEEYEPSRMLDVLSNIERSGLWTTPIVLERDSLAVMDGHHRLAAAQRLKLAYVPSILLDYQHVTVVATRAGFRVDGEAIIARAKARTLYPPKTTKHLFFQALPSCKIALTTLLD